MLPLSVPVQTGEALLEIGEWRAAVELCFSRCELPSFDDAADAPVNTLAAHVRGVLGRCVAAARTAVEADPRVSAPATLRALLGSLTRMQQAMKLITDRDMEVREALYWLTFNATVRMVSVCEVSTLAPPLAAAAPPPPHPPPTPTRSRERARAPCRLHAHTHTHTHTHMHTHTRA
jgi:hypothetical protein